MRRISPLSVSLTYRPASKLPPGLTARPPKFTDARGVDDQLGLPSVGDAVDARLAAERSDPVQFRAYSVPPAWS